VIERGVMFLVRGGMLVLWCCIGGFLTYAALYAFTPYGLAIIAGCAMASALVSAVAKRTWPETLGLIGGPGVFCLLVARNVDDPVRWTVTGWIFIGVAVVSYAAVQSARHRRDGEVVGHRG